MKPRIVPCPHCKQDVEWSASSPYRPFCSERCKMIDLGLWADEQYRVPLTSSDTGVEE
ncbi:DNA gyrase inhibitor YacG [Parachitinimonas caeni]|uniref:DNA gyrase inhibitor YacG n=1 Tax=Parachitinimonas caeni TaxID=3031301 RepID=A0ABT7DVD8_9NEIS|nr:DNA gyrase inhibitor YacG [Parachitinimonas caeni]MDK2124027.1 DNA gyrase inhibitor YacG [Parachitinimonas caeni]